MLSKFARTLHKLGLLEYGPYVKVLLTNMELNLDRWLSTEWPDRPSRKK